MENNLILVSNWDKVDSGDFYLQDDWIDNGGKENVKNARKLQREGNLYEAFIVEAKNYAIYSQMDAQQVFINDDSDVILECESAVIDNKHSHRIEYEY